MRLLWTVRAAMLLFLLYLKPSSHIIPSCCFSDVSVLVVVSVVLRCIFSAISSAFKLNCFSEEGLEFSVSDHARSCIFGNGLLFVFVFEETLVVRISCDIYLIVNDFQSFDSLSTGNTAF